MKTFKYDFNYKAKSYKGTVESPLDLATYGGENERTLMRLLANKYGFDSDFTNSSRSKHNIMVFRVEEQKYTTSSNATNQTTSSTKNNNSSQENNLGSGLGNLASGVGAGVGSAISGTLSGVGSLAGKGWDSLNKELDKGVEDNKRKRQAIEEKANEISKIEFGSTANEIQSQLEQLIAYGNTLSSEQTPIKKAVYSKVTFGIMRLKSLGANDTASFFEAQSKKIKPNLWNTIWFWATFSNT